MLYTQKEAADLARQFVNDKFGTKRGSIKAAARELQVSVDSLSDLKRGKGAPPWGVLEAMGMERVLMYSPKKEDLA